MKKVVLFILTLILLLPPMQVHADVVIYEEATHHFEDVIHQDEGHIDSHHKNDTHEDKHTEHHHHCIDFSLSSVFIPTTSFQLTFPVKYYNKQLILYTLGDYNSPLSDIFQPPKNY